MTIIPTPRTQGLQSSTFTQPPLDGSLSVPALLDWQAAHSPLHPLFTFEESPGSRRVITWNEGHQAMQRATKLVREKIGYAVQTHSNEDPPVVAILASADSTTFATFLAGAWRSGCTVFPLSLRNSPEAIAALLQQTRVSHVFISSDKSTRELLEAARKNFQPGFSVETHDMPKFEDLYLAVDSDATLVSEVLTEVHMEKPVLILHSSGATAFPKPITMTHRALLIGSATFCFTDTDLAGSIFGFHSVPPFHVIGANLLLKAISTGATFAVFKPQNPPIVPNPVNTFEGAITCDYAQIPPAFLEAWSEDCWMVEAVAKIKGLVYGGAPLSKSVGDTLISNGTTLYMGYGSTETFQINSFLQKATGTDWEYFEIAPDRGVHFIDKGENIFELVVLATDWYCPNVINCRVNDRDGFNTKDLVSPHPTKPGLWKIVGRADDQIMHSNGEKTNPGPLEAILKRDPFVSSAVIFGRGQFQCGVLVEPKDAFKFDPNDINRLNEFKSLIWPTVEEMNTFAPQHSRIFKEMILVASPSKPLQYTPKGTPRRRAVLSEYAAEIENLYALWENSSQEGVSAPSDWNLYHTKQFIRHIVHQVLKNKSPSVLDSADLFENGLDSLQATWIRNTILHALGESRPSLPRELPMAFVYDNPTISRLSQYISDFVKRGSTNQARDATAKRDQLFALVDRYTAHFPVFRGHKSPESGRVVLLTGGTGSLGSNILAKLMQDPSVVRVYAMSRPSSSRMSTKERHLKTLEREGLDTALLNDPKVRFLDGDAEKADFGIDEALYEEMQCTTTHIIHNAWRVNFDIAVESFETNIRSVRNFVDFALGSILEKPPKILFIGSIDVFHSYLGDTPAPEEHLLQPDSAIGTGYGESKWVSEQILRRASEETPLSSTIVRCGQLTGGPSGAWNSHEWLPSLVKSSVVLGKLLDAEGSVSWVTAFDAAAAVLDMLDAPSDVLHVVSRNCASWSSVASIFANELKLRVVTYSEWLDTLEAAYAKLQEVSNDAGKVENILRENPALRLMDFFRDVGQWAKVPDNGSFGQPNIGNEKAVQVSSTLRRVQPVTPEDVKRWVSYWRKTGFIP